MIILDMEMPKNCKDCRINVYGRCGALRTSVLLEIANEERNDNCPIKAEIPKNATNGDVIKAMFPQAIFTDSMVEGYVCTIECHLIGRDTKTMYFDADWWNAPWKGQKNELCK